MRLLFAALLGLLFFVALGASPARAQTTVQLCEKATAGASTCSPITPANPLSTSLSGGSAIIGTVDIDQTTPGVTNGVQDNTVLAAVQAVLAAIQAAALTPPLAITGSATTNRSTTLTSGAVAQTIAGGTPTNGYEVCNPDATEDLWVSDNVTAVINGTGVYRAAANGGCYSPALGSKPVGAISVIAATTGHKMSIKTW